MVACTCIKYSKVKQTHCNTSRNRLQHWPHSENMFIYIWIKKKSRWKWLTVNFAKSFQNYNGTSTLGEKKNSCTLLLRTASAYTFWSYEQLIMNTQCLPQAAISNKKKTFTNREIGSRKSYLGQITFHQNTQHCITLQYISQSSLSIQEGDAFLASFNT